MPRLCIGHGGDLGTPSGGTNRVTAIAAGLDAEGYDVTLVAPEPTGDVPERLRDVDLRSVVPADASSARRAIAVTRATERIGNERDSPVQLEHSSLAGFGTLHGQSDYVLDMHDLAYPRFELEDGLLSPVLTRGVRWLERRAVDRARHVVVVSEYMREFLVDRWAVSPEEITVVPNGYFPETVEPYRGADVEPGRVAFLGTLHPKVDVEAFVEIASLSATSEVVVVGAGAKLDELRARSDDVDGLRVTGRLPDEDAFPLIASAEVVVNPQSTSEIQRSSSPVKLFYYAALERPMVVTEGPSVVDEFVERGAALSASSRGPFVDAVQRVLTDDDLATELSESAGEVARELRWENRVATLSGALDGETP